MPVAVEAEWMSVSPCHNVPDAVLLWALGDVLHVAHGLARPLGRVHHQRSVVGVEYPGERVDPGRPFFAQ